MPTVLATARDRANSLLAVAHAAGDPTFMVTAGEGPRFGTPTPAAPVRFLVAQRATLVSGQIAAASVTATFLCTARTGDVLSGLTLQAGDVDHDFAVGDPIAILVLAATVNDLNALALANEAALAAVAADATVVRTTGSYADPAWIASLAGSKVSGNIAGNAATITGSITESQVTNLVSDLALKAPLASPTFTGTPAAPTATAGTSTTQVATTAFVASGLAPKAPLAAPTFAGPVTVISANNATTPFVTFSANNQSIGLAFNYQTIIATSTNPNADLVLGSQGVNSYIWLGHDNTTSAAGLRVGIDQPTNTIWFGNRTAALTADSGHTISIGQTSNSTTVGMTVNTTTGSVYCGAASAGSVNAQFEVKAKDASTPIASFYNSSGTPGIYLNAAGTQLFFGGSSGGVILNPSSTSYLQYAGGSTELVSPGNFTVRAGSHHLFQNSAGTVSYLDIGSSSATFSVPVNAFMSVSGVGVTKVRNSGAGATATGFWVGADDSNTFALSYLNSSWTASGIYLPNRGVIETTPSTVNGLAFNTQTNAPVVFCVNSVATMTVAATGNVGIGTQAPIQKVGVVGSVGFQATDSTTADQSQAVITPSWAVSTHATRKGRVAILASDFTGTDREGLRVESDGTQALVGFFGGTAVARPAAIADTAGATLAALETEVNKLKQLLRNYNLMAP